MTWSPKVYVAFDGEPWLKISDAQTKLPLSLRPKIIKDRFNHVLKALYCKQACDVRPSSLRPLLLLH